MSIYVDKLPESCECCPCNDDYYRCGLSGDLFDEHDTYAGRMKNCKLKQLADIVEVVRCADCVYRPCKMMPHSYDFDYCSFGERAKE